MDEQTTKPNVGSDSEALCFDKNEFMKENFSVDEFLHKNRNAPSLEQLRDNLGLYLKGLRASMIDLINEDYADFVSLSANLVGLDQSIDVIQKPLEQLRDEIKSMETLIQENETEIRNCLKRKQELREMKHNLQCLKKVHQAMEKLKDILDNQLCKSVHPEDLERAAIELIQLQFNKKFCAEYLNNDQQQIIQKLEEDVFEKLRLHFNETVKTASSTCSEHLERCLRIYITLNSCHIAESVFRQDFVGPYMNTAISETNLQNCPQGLAGVYSKILNFVSLRMTDLLRVTQYSNRLVGFNFLVNSFWVEVEMRLETHMTSIFAPGNSEVFHAKYTCTREFLLNIEKLLPTDEDLKYFRKLKQTKSFHARWNLPVYFQICFQEIAGPFEAVLHPILSDDILNKSNSLDTFQLSVFNICQNAMLQCWDESIYLPEIFPKYFKLYVQINSRLASWIHSVIKLTTVDNKNFPENLNKINILTALYADSKKFINLLPIMNDMVWKCISKDKQTEEVEKAVTFSSREMQATLDTHLERIQESFVTLLLAESCLQNVYQVNDLPRLYRKTNRDIPTRPSPYVEQLLRPLKAFVEQHMTNLGQIVIEEVLRLVCSKITASYFLAVSDVLTSVQKTEESLKRLRSVKNTATSSASNTTNITVSDDDKIRLQLQVDVTFWTSELGKLNVPLPLIDNLTTLNETVELCVMSIKVNRE